MSDDDKNQQSSTQSTDTRPPRQIYTDGLDRPIQGIPLNEKAK